MSKIQELITYRLPDRPSLLWLEIKTEDGLVGLGETFRGAVTVDTFLHEEVAAWLIGRDARQIEAISRHLMTPYVGYGSSSAEIRGASAVDIALWDLAGQRQGIPIYEALGGASRASIPVYNTCAGYSFNTNGKRRDIQAGDEAAGPYDDQVAFMRDAGALAQSLLAENYQAMKIWPFDIYAPASGGQLLTLAQLDKGLEPFHKIREAVGNQMEIMCELHGLFGLHSAKRICQALEELNVYWVEDPLGKMDDVAALTSLRQSTRVPICGSESLAGVRVYRDLLAAGVLDVVMLDLAWCGGFTEGRKIAALAQAYNRPIAPHDCTGPITLMAGLHFSLHATTAIYQEVVRATLATWYRDIVTHLPVIDAGMALPPQGAGLGTQLQDSFKAQADVVIRCSR